MVMDTYSSVDTYYSYMTFFIISKKAVANTWIYQSKHILYPGRLLNKVNPVWEVVGLV